MTRLSCKLYFFGGLYVTAVCATGLLAEELVPDAKKTNQPEAKATGEDTPASRSLIVAEFLKENPEHPLQYWAEGKVWNGEAWLPHSLIIEQGKRWNEVYRYQQERNKLEDTFRSNLFLADGCRAHQLFPEERAHLSRVLMFDYSFHEAHQRLGHININGFWITPRQIQLTARSSYHSQKNLQKWMDPIIQFHKRYAKARPGSPAEKAIGSEIMDIKTPDAIPALERFFASKGRRETLYFQDWLATIDSHHAGEALIRQAVFHNTADLRTRAAKLLRNRRFEQYVPYAIGGLTRKETRYSLEIPQLPTSFATLPFRTLNKQVVVDGYLSTHTIQGSKTVLNEADVRVQFRNRLDVWGPIVSGESAAQAVNIAYAGIGDALLTNYGTHVLESPQELRINRIMRALSLATETEIDESQQWFDWWRAQNDLELKNGKLKFIDKYDGGTWYVDNRRVQRANRIQLPPPPRSCFVAKTLIETEHGPRRIEEIIPGDRVLSQDIETGELTFKPVLETTVRKYAQTLRIKTQEEVIHCSTGHPFWIDGLGWRMAKELKPGMPLLTLKGNISTIQEIKVDEKKTVHNLIVLDFSTYFVGKSKFLTHDVTPRLATDCVAPGILRKFE